MIETIGSSPLADALRDQGANSSGVLMLDTRFRHFVGDIGHRNSRRAPAMRPQRVRRNCAAAALWRRESWRVMQVGRPCKIVLAFAPTHQQTAVSRCGPGRAPQLTRRKFRQLAARPGTDSSSGGICS
jgi:hypothetical protein